MDAPVPARWQVVRAGLVTAHLTRGGGGVFTSVRQFARVLEKEPGIEIEVFGPSRPKADLSEWSPLTPRTARPLGPKFFSYAPGLMRRVIDADLNLLHLHGLWMHPSAVSLAFTRWTRRPHMISPHGMLDPWALANSAWKKRLAAAFFENANINSAACLHALNAPEADSIRAYGFTGPVCVIPNGIDLPAADEPPPAAPWWTKTDPGVKTLLYLGRLHPKKNLPALMKAWSLLDPEARKRWRLVIAGWAEHDHHLALRRIAAALHIEASVTFSGPVFGQDKKGAYHYCDGFALPSLSEGLPMVLLEAWACGKPILMTPQCNLPEGFEAGAAVRVEPDEESILTGLRALLAMSDAERQAMGAKGRELAVRRYAWPVIAAEMAGVYRWLAAGGPQPASVSSS